jgi:hypothetical protein
MNVSSTLVRRSVVANGAALAIVDDPGRGVVIQSVGRLTVTASAGELIALHGPADDVNLGGGFCEALAG